MNLLYYRARKQGLSPADAMDEVDPSGSTDVQTSAPDDSAWSTPDFPAQPPPPPPPAPAAPPMVQAPNGVTGQLAAALARARQRSAMPDNINDDALAKQLQSDEQSAAQDKFTEALRAAFTRQAPSYAKSGPSAATQALMTRRQTFQQGAGADQSAAFREAQLLKGEQPKPLDPSLAALHEASALNLKGLEAQRASEELRKKGLDSEKSDRTKKAADAEAASLESQRAIMSADPHLKRLGITPDVLAKLDRKGLEDVQRELAGKFGAGAPAAAGGDGGKRLPATSLKELGDLDAADEQLAHLEEQGTAANIGSLKNSAMSYLPERLKANTDVGRYEDAARAAMQGVGVILEHGKLAAGDELKYRRLLPEPGDDATTMHHKISELRGYLKQLKAKHEAAYQQGRYSVPGGGDAGVQSWKNTKTGRVVKGTAEQLKASKNPDDWVAM